MARIANTEIIEYAYTLNQIDAIKSDSYNAGFRAAKRDMMRKSKERMESIKLFCMMLIMFGVFPAAMIAHYLVVGY